MNGKAETQQNSVHRISNVEERIKKRAIEVKNYSLQFYIKIPLLKIRYFP